MTAIHTLLKPGTGLPIEHNKHISEDKDADNSRLGFKDILDIVNPLHHIPVIGHFYRKITGDTIHPAIKIAGGTLFGGPIGAVFSTFQIAFLDDKKETSIPAGGIDAEKIAGTYPFAESIKHKNDAIDLTQTNSIPLSFGNNIPNPAYQGKNNVISNHWFTDYQKPIIYSDGITNLASLQRKQKTELLLADQPDPQATSDMTTLIKNTYNM